jgi:competence CoiA-like predicted nuclease
MIYAKSDDGKKIKAVPGSRASCPVCNGDVLAKCGVIKVWHWAHINLDCDPWHEDETAWHIAWKERFPSRAIEVTIENHRADLILNRTVWELQHSPISVLEIYQRQKFYMSHGYQVQWIIDASKFEDNFNKRNKGDYATFRWKWKHPTLAMCRNVHLDLGDGRIFTIKKQYAHMYSGWGYLNDTDDFIKKFMKS